MVSDEVINIVRENGWNFWEKCRCSGVLKHKYRHNNKPGMELELWVNYQKFQIKKLNKTVVPPSSFNQLKTTLQNL